MPAADTYPLATQPAPLRFAVAIGLVGLVLLIEWTSGGIDPGSQFLLLATAVVASAWFAGTGPALLATVGGVIFGASQALDTAVEAGPAQRHLALFIVHGLLSTALISELRRARSAAERQMGEAHAARRESEAAGRMKDEFLATISHELRTPLNAVLGWVQLLRTGKLDAATAGRGLESVERNVRLQAQLTGDLLDVSQALTGRLQVDSRPVCLSEATRQAIGVAQPAAQARGVRITSSIPDAAVPVLGDSTRVRQIAWHLLTNGIKFTPRHGIVDVTVQRTADSALLVVSDSGPGIDPAFLPRIFERFAQADASPTRAAGGLGVGLSLVRDLVELHGGEISAGNSMESGGAILRVRFPLHDAAPQAGAPATSAHDALASGWLDGIRVLIVDQDADGRELLRTLLQRQGAVVQTAASVADALEALEAWRPDVLVTDSATPDHASYALIGRVQALERHRGGRIPAAALTAFARRDRQVREMLESVQRDVPKPVEPAVLTTEIARLTGRERRPSHRTP